MRIVLELALAEFRRILARPLMALAMVAVVCIPTIYSTAYLYANSDPYGNLTNLPVAIVNEDEPAAINGKSTNFGDQITDDLLKSGQFKFSVTGLSEANEGVTSGQYAFAIYIPGNFSSNMSDLAKFNPKTAEIVMLTNDANSFLSHQIATEATTVIALQLNGKVSAQVFDQMLIGFAEVHDKLSEAADGADELYENLAKARDGSAELSAGVDKLIKGVAELQSGAGKLLTGADKLAAGLSDLKKQVETMPAQTRELADGAQKVADGNAEIAGVADEIRKIADELDGLLNQEIDKIETIIAEFADPRIRDILNKILEDIRSGASKIDKTVDTVDDELDQLADGAQQVADATETLAELTPKLVSGIDQLSDGADELRKGVGQLTKGIDTLASDLPELRSGVESLHDGLKKLTTGADELSTGLRDGLKEVPYLNAAERKQMTDFIESPVKFHDSDDVSGIGYASGLAPFFIGLSTWIGAYILLLLLHSVPRRALAANAAAWKTALSGWIPAAVFVLAQVSVLELAVSLLDIRIANPGHTWLFMALIGLTYVTILQAFIMLADKVGVFIGLVLLVLQLTTSGGTFPWETMPGKFRVLHHFFPMSYAVDGLRQLMYGASAEIARDDALILGGYLLAAAVAVVAVARFRREWLPEYLKPPIHTV
jgi:putative membrane protein